MHPGYAAAQELVHQLAADLRRGRVAAWPEDLDLAASVCAMVEMSPAGFARIYRNPRHTSCVNEEGLFVVAASLVLTFAAQGLGESWMAPRDGFGHTTLLSDSVWDVLSDPAAVIPLSQMPPLD